MKILVTGSEGFIGQHLVHEFETAGHRVVGIDRCNGDLTVPGVFAHYLKVTNPDRVVHLAAQVGRLFGEQNLRHTIDSNATMTTFVADACGWAEVPVLYTSTSEVYGDQDLLVCREDGPLTLPHNLYGLSKRWGEEVLRLYAPEGLRIARLSMPYGPGAPPGQGRRAMDNFLWLAHHRQVLTVHRGAERSWCHVSDTVRGLRLILESGTEEVYNVGRDDRPLPMLKLAEMACVLTGATYDLIEEVDAPGRQTVVKRLNTDRLRRLGWEPQVELGQGLPELYEWIKRFDAEGRQAA